jgi:hypothetical protein
MMPRAVLREISESQNPEAVALILAEPLHRSLRHTSNLLPVTFLSVVPRSSIGGAASLLPKDHYQDGKHHRRQSTKTTVNKPTTYSSMPMTTPRLARLR